MMHMMIFTDDQDHEGLVEYIEGLAAMLGAKVEIRQAVTITTEDDRIAQAVEDMRARLREKVNGPKPVEVA